jgi:hypothetical protein
MMQRNKMVGLPGICPASGEQILAFLENTTLSDEYRGRAPRTVRALKQALECSLASGAC